MTTTAYGYLGVGLCGRCSYPRHLFVSSDEPDNSARCQDCHNRYAYQDVALHVPIMDETPKCGVCSHPEFSVNPDNERDGKWQFITAYLADRERTIIVHRDCSTLSRMSNSCTDCDFVYATMRNLDWRRIGSFGGYATLTQIEGEHRCEHCASEYIKKTEANTASYPVLNARTSITETVVSGIETRSIAVSVTTTITMSATTVALVAGTVTDTSVQMTRTRILRSSIVTRTDLAPTSLAKVSTISALS